MIKSLSFFFCCLFLFFNFYLNSAEAATPGSLSQMFNINVTAGDHRIHVLRVQPDEKILVGGEFNTVDGVTYNRLVRINTDGTVDSSFDIGSGLNAAVRTLKLLPDGDVLLSGNFTTYNGISANRTIRLNSDASVDNGFNFGTGFDATTYDLEIDNDGKYLYIGNFNTYNGTTTTARFARLNTDGSIDETSILPSGIAQYPFSIEVQPDGKILIGGTFNTSFDTSLKKLFRLNNDLSLDTDFNENIGTGANNTVLKALPLNNGKILVAGTFTEFNGLTTNGGLVLLNSDGTLNQDFMDNIGSGIDSHLFWGG